MARRAGGKRVRFARGLLTGALAVSLASPLAAADHPLLPGIGDEDHRVPIDSQAWPWSAIGRLNNVTGRRCTATLVAADAVVTAAHCLRDATTGQLVPPSALHFVAGYRRGGYLAHAVGQAIETGEAQGSAGHAPAEALADDWAIVRITPPLAIPPLPVRSLPFATAGAAQNGPGRLMRAGYGQDRPHMLAVHDGCQVRGTLAAGHVLLTDCDATRGDSGSPLLWRTGGDFALVGVTSAIEVGAPGTGTLVVSADAFLGRLANPPR